MTSVKISRALVHELVEMVESEGADEAIIDRFNAGDARSEPTWAIKFARMSHVLEFFMALGLTVGEDEANAGLSDEDEDWFGADDAREIAQRAKLWYQNGRVVVYFPGVELVTPEG